MALRHCNGYKKLRQTLDSTKWKLEEDSDIKVFSLGKVVFKAEATVKATLQSLKELLKSRKTWDLEVKDFRTLGCFGSNKLIQVQLSQEDFVYTQKEVSDKEAVYIVQKGIYMENLPGNSRGFLEIGGFKLQELDKETSVCYVVKHSTKHLSRKLVSQLKNVKQTLG